jgi:hypothetical protein
VQREINEKRQELMAKEAALRLLSLINLSDLSSDPSQ